MLKLKVSDPGFEWFYFLVTSYAAYKNNFMFQDLRGFPELELNMELKSLEEMIKEFIEVGEL